MSRTINTPLPFGKHKGIPLKNCPQQYLQWAVGAWKDTEFHDWYLLACEALEENKKYAAEDAAETDADAFLKKHGYDDLVDKPRRYGRR